MSAHPESEARFSHSADDVRSFRAVRSSSEVQGRAVDVEEFLRLIEPLELAADRTLDGSGREKAFQAWTMFPRGFAVVARRALKQGKTNPVGLMLWMLNRHHHEAAEYALNRAEAAGESRPEGTCFVCSKTGPVFGYAGQWFCETHCDQQEAFDGGVRL